MWLTKSALAGRQIVCIMKGLPGCSQPSIWSFIIGSRLGLSVRGLPTSDRLHDAASDLLSGARSPHSTVMPSPGSELLDVAASTMVMRREDCLDIRPGCKALL